MKSDSFVFYAIVDENNDVLCLNNPRYESAKAVFYDREEALKCLESSTDKSGLRIDPVYISPATK